MVKEALPEKLVQAVRRVTNYRDMNTRCFDVEYFSLHPQKLYYLREWLPNHTDLDLLDLAMCRFIRREALGLISKRSTNEDLSIGQFIGSYGGIQEFLDTPAYEICPTVAAIAFAMQYVFI